MNEHVFRLQGALKHLLPRNVLQLDRRRGRALHCMRARAVSLSCNLQIVLAFPLLPALAWGTREGDLALVSSWGFAGRCMGPLGIEGGA